MYLAIQWIHEERLEFIHKKTSTFKHRSITLHTSLIYIIVKVIIFRFMVKTTHLKLLQPSTTPTMFLPISCTSPFTVAKTTVATNADS